MTRALPVRALPVFAFVLACGVVGCEPDKRDQFEVEMNVDGDGIVVSAPEGLACDGFCDVEFDEGTRLTLQARARSGAVFFEWGGDCAPGGDAKPEVSAEDVIDLVLEDDIECTALFVDEELVVDDDDPVLSVIVVGPGSIVASGGFTTLSCGADERCAGRFPQDEIATIDAISQSGAELVGFSGDCELLFEDGFSGSAQVLMDGDRTCTVSFFGVSDVSYPIRIFVEGHGRVTTSPAGIDCDEVDQDCEARFDHGTFVTLSASPDPGWTFVDWGHACEGAAFGALTIDLEMTFGLACSAVFERQLDVTVIGGGRVDSSDPPFACDFGTCTLALTDEGVELTATPDVGQRFVGWSGQCSGTALTTVVPANASACTATFELVPPILTVDIVGAGTVTSDGAIECPGTCSAEVDGDDGIIDPGEWVCSFSFFGTDDGCDCGCGLPDPDCGSSLASACQFFGQCGGGLELVVEDRNHLCYGEDTGTPSITLVAVPDEGFVFSSWQGGCSGTSPTLTLSVAAATTCQAVFVEAIDVTLVRASPRLPFVPVELAVSADGTRIAVLGSALLVLDAATAATVLDLPFTPRTIAAIDTNPSAPARIATALSSHVIEVLPLATGATATTLSGHTSAPSELAFSPTPGAATDFASGDAGGRVKLWSTTTGLVQRTLVPHATRVHGLAFASADVVVSVGADGDVVTTSISGVAVDALATAAASVTAASCTRTSSGAVCAVATAAGDVHVVLADLGGTLTTAPTRTVPGGSIVDIDVLDVLGGNERALVTLADGSARALELGTGALVALVTADAVLGAGGATTRAVLVGDTVEIFAGDTRTHALTSVAWTRAELLAGRRVMAGGGFAPIVLFEAAGGVRNFATPGNVVQLVRGALGGGSVFASTGSSVVRIDADDGTQTGVISGVFPSMQAFAMNAAEDRLAAAADSANDNVIVYELPVGDPFRTLTGHFNRVNDVAFAGDNVISGSVDGEARTFALTTGALVGSAIFASFAAVSVVDANSNGAVAGAAAGDFMVIDTATGEALFELDLGCTVDDVALSFDGSVAAASCTGDRIVLVDIGLGAPRGEIVGSFGDVRFAPDELVLLAVDDDGWRMFELAP